MRRLRAPSRRVLGSVGALVLVGIIVVAAILAADSDTDPVAVNEASPATRSAKSTAPDRTMTDSDGTTTSSSAPTTGPSTKEPTSTAAPAQGTERPVADDLPPGVPEQLTFVNVGDPQCQDAVTAGGPTVVSPKPTFYVLEDADICLPGFDKSSQIDVSVVGPDGNTASFSYPESNGLDPQTIEVAFVSMMLDIDAPTGRYDVTALQGATAAQGSFTVDEPNRGTVRVAGQTAGAPGDEFIIWVAGFPSGGPATIDRYVSTGSDIFHYFTTTVVPATDQLGRAEDVLVTSARDPRGTYCLVPRGTAICSEITLE
jgi:hypothetical protein